MTKPALAALLTMVLAATAAHAQDLHPGPFESKSESFAFSQMTPTPEMWMYSQSMKLYNDPKFCVRQNAAFEAAQRQQRIASRAWYGVSLSRPRTEVTNVMAETGQMWGSNTRNGNVWAAGSSMPIYLTPPMRTVSTTYGLW